MSQQPYADLDDLFAGSGAPAIKFTSVGDSVSGIITDAEVRQQRDYDSNEPKFWDDGKPMMEVILTITTSLRDSSIEDDDGTRRVFCRGQMLTAMRDAVRKAKARKPEVGGKVTITHSGLGEAKKRGFNPPKLFTVAYEPPTAVQMDAMFAEGEPTPAAVVDSVTEAISNQADLLGQAASLDPAALAKLLGELQDSK